MATGNGRWCNVCGDFHDPPTCRVVTFGTGTLTRQQNTLVPSGLLAEAEARGYARAIAERTGCRACGYLVILADTENWPAPLCAGCHERHVAVERSEYARAIADVCAWLRTRRGSDHEVADEIEEHFGARKDGGDGE